MLPMQHQTAPKTLLLNGRDHHRYGRLHHESLTPDVAGAISVGGSPTGRSMVAKAEPNEDALVAVDDGVHLLLAVADAHFGAEASHHFIDALKVAAPKSPAAVRACIADALLDDAQTASETTLTAVVMDHASGRGYGISFGDSSAIIIDADGARRLFDGNSIYLCAGGAASLALGVEFEFELAPNALLVLFTDGVDECHYRRPETSIGMRHLHDLFLSTRGDPKQFARRLGAKALNGVDDNPGGEDNIALLVARRMV